MSDLRTAARLVLEAYDAHDPLTIVMEDLRAALVDDAMQKFSEVNQELEAALAIMKPEITAHKAIPPEAQTEAEKIAYCAGWWDALEKKREQHAELLEVVHDAIATLHHIGYPTAAADLRAAVEKVEKP